MIPDECLSKVYESYRSSVSDIYAYQSTKIMFSAKGLSVHCIHCFVGLCIDYSPWVTIGYVRIQK